MRKLRSLKTFATQKFEQISRCLPPIVSTRSWVLFGSEIEFSYLIKKKINSVYNLYDIMLLSTVAVVLNYIKKKIIILCFDCAIT